MTKQAGLLHAAERDPPPITPEVKGHAVHIINNNIIRAGGGETTHPRCERRLPREGGGGASDLGSLLRRYTNCSRPVKIGKVNYL